MIAVIEGVDHHPKFRPHRIKHKAGEVFLDFAGAPYSYAPNVRRYHVCALRVDEEARGCGRGRRLMLSAIRAALRDGYGLELRVWQDNTRAVALYLSLGFSIIEEPYNFGAERPYYFMVRDY